MKPDPTNAKPESVKPKSLTIAVGKKGDAVVLKLDGRMDATGAAIFDHRCNGLLEDGETGFIVDMAGVDFISSPGLRSLLLVGKKVKEAGGKFLLANMGGGVQEVFDLSGLSAWKMDQGKWAEE